ncbi:MAG: hypothetical protein E7434_08350 [Ruminococcaceae bacterium]|nr:hypothetical protein [Oscillospiraceae bacterium]
MKQILSLLLCLVMLFALVACSNEKSAEETTAAPSNAPIDAETTAAPESNDDNASEEQPSEEHDHTHINYRGRQTMFTADDLSEIEGREYDFTYEQNGNPIYIYNNVTVDNMSFTQVQFSFSEANVRVSCTYTASKGTEEAPVSDEDIQKETDEKLASYKSALTAIYGEGAQGEQHGSTYTSWSDHSGNYIIMTRINETTVQVAYYICATAAE